MDNFDKVTLKAFLVALTRQNDSLPTDLQNHLKEIGNNLPSDVSQLHGLAKEYSPLHQEYMEARIVLQNEGDRLRFSGQTALITAVQTDNLTEISDEKLINVASVVFNAEDSVRLVQQAYTESSELGQLLFQLRRQTSFIVKDPENIPEDELWIWQNPEIWASLERGLRQAETPEVYDLGSFAQYADLEIDD